MQRYLGKAAWLSIAASSCNAAVRGCVTTAGADSANRSSGSDSNSGGGGGGGGSSSSAASVGKQAEARVPAPQQMVPGPYRRVGNIIFVTAFDHPFKFGWEVNKMLRDLRIEFKGQSTVHPDTPEVRLRLWRVRHAVKCEVMDIDRVKELIGVPAHVTFTDIARTIPDHFGRGPSSMSPLMRAKRHFTSYRRQRLRDIMHRDAVELRLLAEKKKLRAAREAQLGAPGAGGGGLPASS